MSTWNWKVLAGAATAAAVLYAARLYNARARKSVLVKVEPTKQELGRQAARHVAALIIETVAAKGHARIIVATGASQFEFIAELVKLRGIPWDKVTAFHLDEYFLSDSHPASFRKYLKERLFSKLSPQPHKINYLDPDAPEAYAAALASADIDLACIGVGENGHIAFNDPPPGGCDFADPVLVKKVALDHACRMQQLGEGWFDSLASVPTHALTLTVPAIMRARAISCAVPDSRKADAVAAMLSAPISPACPATILRTHPNCVLWLDPHSAAKLPSSAH